MALESIREVITLQELASKSSSNPDRGLEAGVLGKANTVFGSEKPAEKDETKRRNYTPKLVSFRSRLIS